MWGKPLLHDLEKEFRTSKMRDRHVFHDINLRVNDPNEFRTTSLEYLRGLGYAVGVNEMTDFEEGEFSKFFRGGRLKPLKNILKASKVTKLGSRFPFTWKLLLLIGIVSFSAFLLPYEELNKDFLFYVFMSSFIFSGLLYLIKSVIISSVWVKMVGVYDVEGVKADVRLIISADTSEMNPKVFDTLRDDIAEYYGLMSRRYLKKIPKKEKMIKPATKSKTEELIEKIAKTNKNIEALRDKFINNRVSEEVFRKLLASLNKDKAKYETILDLVGL